MSAAGLVIYNVCLNNLVCYKRGSTRFVSYQFENVSTAVNKTRIITKLLKHQLNTKKTCFIT